ncbi:MAG: sulfotransferase [Candidatus Nanopelagicales bacterium]|nr:sulfotransferase [Candidatus Nanopelagicales bacterium]MDP4887946.1 sulfotransferase [Candidatus Nanopelagicales bacterium]
MDLVWREAPSEPIFVGGTGRSGTTIAGQLLGRHAQVGSTNPRELRFIASFGGLADAYAGQCTPEEVIANLRAHWYVRIKPSGARSGLFRRVSEAELDVLAADYESGFPVDSFAASRRFAETIVSSRTRRNPLSRWVDTTPANARNADRVLALFPEGKVVHMMRDGRDVAASFVSKPFGPSEVIQGLDAWRDRMIEAHRAEVNCPVGRVLRVNLEQLASTDRDATLTQLLDFLGLPADAHLSRWFVNSVVGAQMHGGRWRRDYDDAIAAAVDQRYGEILEELDGLGVPHP